MNNDESPQYLRKLALKVAALLQEAGKYALQGQLNPKYLTTGSAEEGSDANQYRLEVDEQIQRFMRERLASLEAFNGFWEERPQDTQPHQRFWYVGSIDGAVNYVRNMSEWTLTTALFDFNDEGRPFPIIGVVHAPALGLTYLAARQAGALRIHKTSVGEKREKPVPSITKTLDDSVIGFGISRMEDVAKRSLDVVAALAGHSADLKRVGPASLDLCKVADGTYDAYFEPNLTVDDIPAIAAGTVVVWEAQGTMHRWNGDGIYWRYDNDVVATNGLIDQELKQYLQ